MSLLHVLCTNFLTFHIHMKLAHFNIKMNWLGTVYCIIYYYIFMLVDWMVEMSDVESFLCFGLYYIRVVFWLTWLKDKSCIYLLFTVSNAGHISVKRRDPRWMTLDIGSVHEVWNKIYIFDTRTSVSRLREIPRDLSFKPAS